MIKTLHCILCLLPLHYACSSSSTSSADSQGSPPIENSAHPDTLQFSSFIRAIYIDSKGNYWVGSHKEGVCRFDGKSYTYFTTEDGLADNQIRSIKEDKFGNICFGTANGVSVYNGQKILRHKDILNPHASPIWELSDDDLWFNAGTKEGVFRWHNQSLAYLPFPASKTYNPNNVYHTTCISKGENKLWVGTYAGVFGFDGENFTSINDGSLGFTETNQKLHVRSLLEDSKGRLWIGNNGIGVLLQQGDSTINFSEQQGLIHENSAGNGDISPAETLEHVFAIFEDSKGNIWFSDRDTGLWKYDGKQMNNFTIGENHPSIMSWCFFEDSEGTLLVGTTSSGVYRLVGEHFERVF